MAACRQRVVGVPQQELFDGDGASVTERQCRLRERRLVGLPPEDYRTEQKKQVAQRCARRQVRIDLSQPGAVEHDTPRRIQGLSQRQQPGGLLQQGVSFLHGKSDTLEQQHRPTDEFRRPPEISSSGARAAPTDCRCRRRQVTTSHADRRRCVVTPASRAVACQSDVADPGGRVPHPKLTA